MFEKTHTTPGYGIYGANDNNDNDAQWSIVINFLLDMNIFIEKEMQRVLFNIHIKYKKNFKRAFK